MDEDPSISMEIFRALAAEHLSANDYAAFSQADALWTTPTRHPFMITWKAKETALRNALVRARAAATEKDPEQFIQGPTVYDADAEQVSAEAILKSNPLDKEKILDRHRWAVLDEMAGLNNFASESILAYFIKLGIATRWGKMNEDEGRQMANKVMEAAPTDLPESENETVSESNEIDRE